MHEIGAVKLKTAHIITQADDMRRAARQMESFAILVPHTSREETALRTALLYMNIYVFSWCGLREESQSPHGATGCLQKKFSCNLCVIKHITKL